MSNHYRKKANKLALKSKKHYCKYYDLHKESKNDKKG